MEWEKKSEWALVSDTHTVAKCFVKGVPHYVLFRKKGNKRIDQFKDGKTARDAAIADFMMNCKEG